MSTLAAMRVLFILGIVNLVTGAMIFFSCRCLPGAGWAKGLMKYRWYQFVFKRHCRVWPVFWASVAVHAVFAIVYVGWPF